VAYYTCCTQTHQHVLGGAAHCSACIWPRRYVLTASTCCRGSLISSTDPGQERKITWGGSKARVESEHSCWGAGEQETSLTCAEKGIDQSHKGQPTGSWSCGQGYRPGSHPGKAKKEDIVTN
jgi:hypothetical protein